ncbi:MAG: hypothetical protein ACFFEU_00660 [Candidatus Thorarchaeota archaeon]
MNYGSRWCDSLDHFHIDLFADLFLVLKEIVFLDLTCPRASHPRARESNDLANIDSTYDEILFHQPLKERIVVLQSLFALSQKTVQEIDSRK